MKLQLKRSNVLESGAAKEPTASQLEYGELAVNYNGTDPAIFLKDSNNNVIRISGVGNIADDGLVNVPESTTPPANPEAGNLWFNSDEGRLYIYYVDPDTSQWVDASPDSWDNSIIPNLSDPNAQSGTLDDRYRLNSSAAGASQWDDVTGGINYASGKVGIGTTSPQAQFVISNVTGTTANGMEFDPDNGQGGNRLLSYDRTTAQRTVFNLDASEFNYKQVGNITKVKIDTSGNVGIGTTSPAHTLTLDGDNAQFGIADGLGNYSTIGVSKGGAGQGNLIISTSADTDSLVFQRGATETMRIDSSGNVGIGETSPAVALDVNGQIRSSTGISFGTDTAADDTLDDYEEGTWTPGIEGSTTAGSYTFTGNGAYTKVGNKVTVWGDLADITTVSAGSGNLRVTGLPFTSALGFDATGVILFDSWDLSSAASGYVVAKIGNGENHMNPRIIRDSNTDISVGITAKSNDTADLQFFITYTAA